MREGEGRKGGVCIPIEVPLDVAVLDGVPIHACLIDFPGASTSNPICSSER